MPALSGGVCLLLASALGLPATAGAVLDRTAIGAAQPIPIDLYGDPLPLGAVARLGSPRLCGIQEVQALAFSPDGKLLASRSRGTTQLWEAATGRELHLLDKYQHTGSALAFTPDSKRLVTGGTYDLTVCVWDVATGRLTATLPLPANGYCAHCTAAEDGRLAVATTAQLVFVIDHPDQAGWQQLYKFSHAVSALALAPTGTALAAGDAGGGVCVWDTADYQTLFQLNLKGEVVQLAFSPNGKTLAVATPAQLLLLEARKGTVLRELAPAMPGLAALAFSADGKRLGAAGAADGTMVVRVWDPATGQLLRTATRAAAPRCLALAPDLAVVTSSSFSQRIDLWDAAAGKQLLVRAGHASGVDHLVVLADGKTLATTGADHEVRLWDAATGKPLGSFRHQDDGAWRAAHAFTADGKTLVTWDPARGLGLWRPDNGQLQRQPVGAPADAELLDVAQRGDLVVLGRFGEVIVWDVGAGRLLHKLPAAERVFQALLSPDGRLLATCHAKGSDLWDVATGNHLRHLADFDSLLAFAPDSRWLVGRKRDRVTTVTSLIVADTERPKVTWTAAEDGKATAAVVFSADNRVLAALGWMGEVRLWEVPSRLLLWEFAAHPFRSNPSMGVPRQLGGAAFFPDGWRLAIGHADTTVVVWDLQELVPGAVGRAKTLKEADLEVLWSDLAGGDGRAVFRAQAVLAAAPDKTVAFLKTRLKPIPLVTEERLQKLFADLDAPKYAVRMAAVEELTRLGDLAVAPLRALLKLSPPLEVERRVELLLAKLDQLDLRFPSPTLRAGRAIHVLERIGTPAARQLLEALAAGDPGARQTREAKDACQRLAKLALSPR
jgi:WD40 repeat protein